MTTWSAAWASGDLAFAAGAMLGCAAGYLLGGAAWWLVWGKFVRRGR